MTGTEIDPLEWLAQQNVSSTGTPGNSVSAAAPQASAATPPPAVATAPIPQVVASSARQSNPWIFPSMFLGICILLAALLLRGAGPAPSPDDDKPAPKPVSREVVEAFDKAVTEFIGGFGKDVEAIGKRVSSGDIDTIDEWVEAQKKAYTTREDAFIKTTGELDNKYVPQPVEMADSADKYSPVTTRGLSPAELKQLSDYTVASGKGIQQAVSK